MIRLKRANNGSTDSDVVVHCLSHHAPTFTNQAVNVKEGDQNPRILITAENLLAYGLRIESSQISASLVDANRMN